MKIDYTTGPVGLGKNARITSEEEVVRIDTDTFTERTNVFVEGRHILIIAEGADVGHVTARESKVVTRGSCSVSSLTAREVESDGNLYPLFGMTVTGDARIVGELIGERHFPYEVGGDLSAQAVEVDGHVTVHGEARITDYIHARSFKIGGELSCPNVMVQDQDMALPKPEGELEMAL